MSNISRKKRLLSIIEILATRGDMLSLRLLKQRAGYKTRKAFNEDLDYLMKQGIIEIHKSGFRSDSNRHTKTVFLLADIMVVNSTRELPADVDNEKIRVKITPSFTSTNPDKLIPITSPLGSKSYMNESDFNKLVENKRDILGLPTKHPLRARKTGRW